MLGHERAEVDKGSPEPWKLHGSKAVGVICVHGFTGTPFEMRPLGEALNQRHGWTVLGPCLAGHGQDAAALLPTTWRDWYRSLEQVFLDLRGRVVKVFVVGMSMGSLVSLELARRHGLAVDALVTMAAPLWLARGPTAAIHAATAPVWQRVFGRSLQTVPKFGGGSDIRDLEMKAKNPSLPVFPVPPLRSLLDLATMVRIGIEDVQSPVMVVHGKQDHTAPFACSLELYERLARRPGVTTEKLWLDESYHVLPLDVERDLLAERVSDFLLAELKRR